MLGTAKIFGWRVLLDRLPYRVNLERREILVSSNLCPLCNKDVETLQHLLITCEVAQRLWLKCDNWVGLSTVRSIDIINHFCSFHFSGLSRKANYAWRGMWLAVVKALWIHRNKVIFDVWIHKNKVIFDVSQVDEVEIFAVAQLHAWSWAKFSGLKLWETFAEWCMHPVDCLREIK